MDWDEDLVQGNGATGVSASQVVLQAIKSNALALKRDRAMAAKWTYPLAFGGALLMMLSVELLMPRVKNDDIFMISAIARQPVTLQYASDRLRSNKEVVLGALKSQGQPEAIKYADPTLRSDVDFLRRALQMNPDQDLILLAVRTFPKAEYGTDPGLLCQQQAFFFVPDALQSDKEFILAMALRNPEVLQCVPESMRNDRHFVMSLLKACPACLEHMPYEFQADAELVLAALQFDSQAGELAEDDIMPEQPRPSCDRGPGSGGRSSPLAFAAHVLRSDRQFLLAALALDTEALVYASEDLRRDEEFVLAAVEVNGLALSGRWSCAHCCQRPAQGRQGHSPGCRD
ncbi:unnamed protein product [Symbiodinium sp. KB8]|nr:unnamed protein product [Symbiodinium sp. KB8]